VSNHLFICFDIYFSNRYKLESPFSPHWLHS
jgi:hypothetical protein